MRIIHGDPAWDGAVDLIGRAILLRYKARMFGVFSFDEARCIMKGVLGSRLGDIAFDDEIRLYEMALEASEMKSVEVSNPRPQFQIDEWVRWHGIQDVVAASYNSENGRGRIYSFDDMTLAAAALIFK